VSEGFKIFNILSLNVGLRCNVDVSDGFFGILNSHNMLLWKESMSLTCYVVDLNLS
jgi:hypothetical protein